MKSLNGMISVIVPMYNSSKTIRRCLLSICNQSYHDLEIIVVDDGSTDEGSKYVEELILKDDRLHLIKQQNAGVSSARNCGLLVSNGEYICFVDSDDYIKINYLKAMYDEIQYYKSDISICGYCDVFTDKIIKHILSENDLNSLSGELKGDLYLLRKYINSPCLKLYRSSIIRKHHLMFNQNLVTAEDQLFNYNYFMYCNTICFVNSANYMYIRRIDSLSRVATKQCYENELFNLHNKYKFMMDKKIWNGDKILAESICYFAKRYLFLTDSSNSFFIIRKRILKADILNKYIKLADKKDAILYFLINKKLILPIYLYMRIRNL